MKSKEAIKRLTKAIFGTTTGVRRLTETIAEMEKAAKVLANIIREKQAEIDKLERRIRRLSRGK